MSKLEVLEDLPKSINIQMKDFVACDDLRRVAIKYINSCCGNHRIMETMCGACRRFGKFFKIVMEDLK